MPIASWFCNGYSKVLTALKCSKKLEKAVKAVFWNQLLFALKYVLALSKRLKDVFFFYVYLVVAKVPGTYYQARRSFSSLLGPLHWSSIFPTPREHRNIVQLCTIHTSALYIDCFAVYYQHNHQFYLPPHHYTISYQIIHLPLWNKSWSSKTAEAKIPGATAV